MDLSARIADCLHRHQLTATTGVVAVSGGADSVALAHLCVGLLKEGAIARLILAHVNHQLRGAESDADEASVQRLPALWRLTENDRVSVRTTRIDVAAIAAAEHDNLEAIARRERYRWLTELAVAEQATWIATGHTADDQAETVLLRLIRGSGLLGCAAIREWRTLDERVNLIRPLLGVRRRDLLDYLRERQIAFLVDSSNWNVDFARNRLRLEVMPYLAQHFNPAIVEALCRLADQARELHSDATADAERLLVEAELARAGAMLVFAVDQLQRASANQVREMFRLVWQRESWPMADMDFARWNWLVEIVHGQRGACDFPGNIRIRRAGSVVQLRRGSRT